MKQLEYTWNDIETAVSTTVLNLYKDLWMPDCVVGINRSGTVFATMLSYYIGIPMYPVTVQTRGGDPDKHTESNLWLPEMAVGYVAEDERSIVKSRWDIKKRKNILIVDATNSDEVLWIKQDWQLSCFPKETEMWNSIWHKNVRFCSLTHNWSKEVESDYWWQETTEKMDIIHPWNRESLIKKEKI